MSRTETHTASESGPPPENDHAFFGRPKGLLAHGGIGMPFGLVQYVAGRRHLAGRRHMAEFALAPHAMRRAVRLIVAGVAAAAVLASLRVRTGRGRLHASHKIAIGVVPGGLPFLLMVLPASGHPGDGHLMSAWRIVGSYLLLGLGDILLETSGMSATTRPAPAAFSQTVRLCHDVSQPAHFGVNGAIAVAAGLAVTAAVPWLRRTLHPVH